MAKARKAAKPQAQPEEGAFLPNGQIRPFPPVAPEPINTPKSIEHYHRLIHPDWFAEDDRLPGVNSDGTPKDASK